MRQISETPILDTLNNYLSKNPIRLHVPFHAGIPNNDIFPKELYNLDISEVSGYDIEGKDNPIFQSEKITANFFNVTHSFYLTSGASIGLIASMIALNKFGKKIILARNVHKSVVSGVILAGLEPIWLDVEFLDSWGIFSKVDPNKLFELTSLHKDIAGCVIVSPTYEGVISDIELIAQNCHIKNIPLIVDEAHGAHLSGVSRLLRKRASPTPWAGGQRLAIRHADLVVQSWHKSLGSLTQTGVLHLVNNNFFSYHDIKRSLDLVSSTSPSFLLLLSLELTRKYLDAETPPGAFLQSLLQKSISFREEIKKIKHVSLLNNDDLFKIYIKPENVSGIDFAYRLYKGYAIEIESANDIGFLISIGMNFNEEIKDKVINAIIEISHHHRDITSRIPTKPQINNLKLQPREAFMLGFQENQNIEYECEINAPCPPGYVLEIPGADRKGMPWHASINHVIDALKQKRFFKLVCGASLADTEMIENLCFIFTLAGAHVIDLAPKADVVFAARKGIQKAQEMSFPGLPLPWSEPRFSGTRESSHENANCNLLDSRFRGNDTGTNTSPLASHLSSPIPLLMASINLDKDPHFRKVEVDYNLCTACGACIKVCPAEAFSIKSETAKRPASPAKRGERNGEFTYLVECCFGCGICPSYCHLSALKMIDTMPTPKETLQEMLSLGIQAIEFHFGKNIERIKEIWNDIRNIIETCHGISLLSFSIGSSVLSCEQIKQAANLCYKLAGKDIILQCDGIPMSGHLKKKGNNKDKSCLQVAKIIQEEKLPVYLQISGGTTEKSYSKAYNAGININGIAIGSYARKLLMPYLNNLDDKEALHNAVNIARLLVNSVGADLVSAHL